MLAALAALRHEADFSLNVLHVIHGIRPAEECLKDSEAVESLCGELEVPCRIAVIPGGRIEQAAGKWGTGVEAAARFFRRRALNREAGRINADRILTAHTKDDLLETILMRIIRGCGPAGLAGIPAKNGRYLKPLLGLTRAGVLDYLGEKGISYRTDLSNMDTRYLRNRVRHKLIPVLDENFPDWRSSLLSLAETQKMVADFITEEAAKRLVWDTGEGLRVNSGELFAQPPIIREESVFLAADRLLRNEANGKGLSVPRRKSLRNLLADFENGKTKKGDLGPVLLELNEDRIGITKKRKQSFESGFTLLIDAPGNYRFMGLIIKAGIHTGENAVSGSVLKDRVFYAEFPLVFTKHEPGDFIVRAGHKYRLSDILKQDARKGFTGFITAADQKGNTAFLGTGRRPAVLFCKYTNGMNAIGKNENPPDVGPNTGEFELIMGFAGGPDE